VRPRVDQACERYASLAKRGVDVRANLREIQAGRADVWLAEQDRRWHCPSCGQPISAWWDACHSCKQTLR
jgi:hypothetical protein